MAIIQLTLTDRRRFARARERGREDLCAANAVVKARYDRAADAIEVLFRGGMQLRIPRTRVAALDHVQKRDVAAVTVSAAGDALSWRSADVDIHMRGLIEQLFLTR